MTSTHKTAAGLEIIGEGTLRAVIATLNVRDHDDDVVLPGAIRHGSKVAISTWNHGSWQPGQPPIGTGVLSVQGDSVIVDAQMFMHTQAGAETFAALKELHAVGIGEWSWSLDEIVGRAGTLEGRRVRFIESVRVRECSPVMRGASIGTRTLSAKDRAMLDEARSRITPAPLDDDQRRELNAIRQRVEAMAAADLTRELDRSRLLLARLERESA